MQPSSVHGIPVPTAVPVRPQPYVQSQIPRYALSHADKESLTNIASSALPLANQLIADHERQPIERERVVIHHHHHYSYGYWGSPFWLRPQPVLVVHSGPRRRNDRDDGGRILLGVIATIGVLFASVAVGSAVARLQDANKELAKVQQAKKDIESFEENYIPEDQPIFDSANTVTNLRERICQRIKNSAAWDLALRISLTAGLVVIAVGAFASCPPVLGVALLGTVVIGCAMLLKKGFDSTDRQNYEEAESIQNHMTFLNSQVRA